MRPERSRETGRAARVARARLVLKADLAWLGGYPSGETANAGLGWCVPPTAGRPGRSMHLDRTSLHRATRAVNELEQRLGDGLDDVVGERRAWMAGARAAIDLLKPMVHGDGSLAAGREAPIGTGLFRREVVAAIRKAPEPLRPLLGAAAWITLAEPARLGPLVHFVLAHEGASAALHAGLPGAKAETAALHLALLAEEDGARRVEPLARLLAIRAIYEVPTHGVDYARALSKGPRGARPTRPLATLGPALATWTSTLLAAEAQARRRMLALLAALDLAPAAAQWTAWWSNIARCERLSRGPSTRGPGLANVEPEETEDSGRARAKARRLAEHAPRPLRGDSLTALLETTFAWSEAVHREAVRALAELPSLEAGVSARLLFLEHWSLLLAKDARPAAMTAMAALLGSFARYLARTRPYATRLLPWSRVFDAAGHPTGWIPPDEELLEDVPATRRPVFYEALARAVERGSGDVPSLSMAILGVVPLEGDAVHALALALVLAPHVRRIRDGVALREAFELFGRDVASFGRAVAVLAKPDFEERGGLLHGLQAVRRSGGDDLARALLLDESERLVSCGRRLAVLDMVGGARDLDTVRVAAGEPPWIAAYPAWIAPSLRRLAEGEVNAERAARRLLGDEVRATSVVRRELAHLEALEKGPHGPSDRMRRRITNLRARLASPRAPGATLRAHLVAKVERAARRAKLARLEAALDAGLRARMPSFFGLAEPTPSWLLAPRTMEKIAPIPSFEPPMRALAIRVLRMRAGPPPWDLRDDPANRAFLERLRRCDVDAGPWLDTAGASQRATTADGRTLDLRLEDDPLEILDMGKHFATCLSPGDTNYFSTFAIIADVNKRVLFGRDASGKVVARCLLALTAVGGLVAFHPYAHDATLGFDARVATFTADLAARMRAVVLAAGDVPLLVSPDWYDDGPVDLGGRFPFLKDGAAFRQSLPEIAPAAFAREASRLFVPLPLGALTLPLLVALPEIVARPELLVPLLPAMVASEGMPLETVARVLELLARTPHAAMASRALVPRIVAGLRRAGEEADGWLAGAVVSIIEACPGDALRLLRATRARRVRSWADEQNPRRLEMAARAYEALRRPRLAVSLYRFAAAHAWNAAWSKTWKDKADALEATLEPKARAAVNRRA
jgi:hypothetical protein